MSTGSAFDPQQTLSQHVLNDFYIGGDWVKPQSDRKLELVSPVTEECFLKVPEASEKDVDRGVRAARQAFDQGPWPRMTPQERAKFVLAIGEEMKKRVPVLADVWTAQVGAPRGCAGYIINYAPQLFEMYGKIGAKGDFVETRDMLNGGKALVIREPVGVVAIITPWNAPMVLMSYGVAAALTAGCRVGGRRVAEVCAKRLARYTLELGGKSPAVIMDDADLNTAIGTIVPFAMPMTGQICFSLTRVLVSKKRHDEVVDAYSAAVKKIVVGDPWKAETQMGALSMKRPLDRVMGYLEKGRKEGATLVTGGGRPKDMNRGYFVEPTIFANVDSDMTIAKEEIFGPVVSVMPYEDEEDAIRIANNSTYGLSAAVFTKDTEKGVALARRIRTGNLTINGLKLDNAVPFGGFKESGIGRVGRPGGLGAYQELKSVYLPD